MGSYELIKLHNEPYDFLVIATSYENPINSIDEIEKEIINRYASVLFDLTLINGVKFNRFIQRKHHDQGDIPSMYSLASEIPESIKRLSSEFFKTNRAIVDQSVLPSSLKFLIKENLI